MTDNEVISALRRVAPPEWVQQQAEAVIDGAVLYLTGRADSFTIDVSLVDNKREAKAVIVDLVDRQFADLVEGIRPCTPAELRGGISVDELGLPSCVPEGLSMLTLKRQFGVDIGDAVEQSVLRQIPDTATFTDSQLRQALLDVGAGESVDRVDDVRELLRDGWTYTEADLRQDLLNIDEQGLVDQSAVNLLDDVRTFLTEGVTYTQSDLRALKPIFGETAPNRDIVGGLDDGRDYLKLARTIGLALYGAVLLLLVIIGFLGGRGWAGRIIWASSFLVVSSAIIFLVFGPGYDTFAKSGPIYDVAGQSSLEHLREKALLEISQANDIEFPRTARLAASRAFDIAESMADRFAADMALSSLGLAAIGAIAMVAALFWQAIAALVRRSFGRGDEYEEY